MDLDRWGFSLSLRRIWASSLHQFPRKSMLKSQIQLSQYDRCQIQRPKGIQGMQAVSNLPISARLPRADLNGRKTVASCRGKPSAGSPLVMCYWRPVEISAKCGDQISGSRLAKDTAQGTRPWRLHCTIRTSLLEWKSTFIWPLKALNIHIEWWIYMRRIGIGKNQETYDDLWGGSLQ